MTNCKLSQDMSPQSDVDLEVMWVIFLYAFLGSFMHAMVCTRHDIAPTMRVVNQFIVKLG
jgi:hypothetical protein